MSTQYAPGVRSGERQGAARPISGLASGVAGIIGVTSEGPANRAVKVTSLQQFARIFGGSISYSYMYESAQGFFDNGGSELYVSRVLANAGVNTAATANLPGGTATALIATAVGPGNSYNGIKVFSTRDDNILGVTGSAITTAIPAASVTGVDLVPTVAARLAVGDTVKIADGANAIRFVIGRKLGNRIEPASPVTATAILAVATSTLTLETFTIRVEQDEVTIYGPTGGLRMSNLSDKNFALSILNEANNDELKVTFALGSDAITNTNDNRPNAPSGIPLSGGVAALAGFVDSDYIGDSVNLRGIHAFERVRDVRGLAVPGYTGTLNAVGKALIDYTLKRNNMVGIAGVAMDATASSVIAARNNQIGGNSFGTLYDNWIVILSSRTGVRQKVPADGHILGAWARTDRVKRVSKAPAGWSDGILIGALDVATPRSDGDADLLFLAGINLIQNVEGVGVCLMGARTLERDSDFTGLNVRRTFIYLRTSIEAGLGPELFEDNDDAGRAHATRVVEAFLRQEHKKKNLTGETEDEAFTVICDRTNNPPEVVKARKKKMVCKVNIPDTTEVIEIEFER